MKGGGPGASRLGQRSLAFLGPGWGNTRGAGPQQINLLSQIHRSRGLVTHRGWARLMLDRKCLVEVPNAPRHCAERAHAEADYDEETARDNYFNPPAGHRSGPGGPTDA